MMLRISFGQTVLLVVLLLTCPSKSNSADEWKIAESPLLTTFAADVDPKAPLPEYPRPQMVREEWKNLNGLWNYAITPARMFRPDVWEGEVLVPFPIESPLSGVGKRVGTMKRLHYRTTFDVPPRWNVGKDGSRLLLHFGAVDWKCIVSLNDKKIGEHTGGFSPFVFDITDALEEGEQQLTVSVWDPTDQNWQPRGKQRFFEEGIWYTPVTGIWGTVWLEPVAATHITRIKPVPNLDQGTVDVTVWADGALETDRVSVSVKAGDTIVATQEGGNVGEPMTIDIPEANYWSPDSPFLYDTVVQIKRNGKTVDSVDSYLAMRECKLGKDENGIVRPMLNGKFVFQHGPLYQGWWPDGLYTAPTDKALRFDLDTLKTMGFNMVRNHVKTESARFYHYCDKIGLLVWQDMPSGDAYIQGNEEDLLRSPESAANFKRELAEMIRSLDFFPCIITWVLFNEGWGQFETEAITQLCRELDPGRLVDSASGWVDRNVGDFYDIHAYPGPALPQRMENRASVLGEYGGIPHRRKGHVWQDHNRFDPENEDLIDKYRSLNDAMHPMIAEGLSAAIYTQATDVENETSGLITYDRKVIKFDVAEMAASNDALKYTPTTARVVVPTARTEKTDWRYSFEQPGKGWEKSDFDDSTWKIGKGGFGTEETAGTFVGTHWDTTDIWLRRTVEIAESDLADLSQLRLSIYHDEDATVYVNGVLVLETRGHVGAYHAFSIDPQTAEKAFRPGKNLIAIHCQQTAGGQYIDLGIIQIIPPKEKIRLW